MTVPTKEILADHLSQMIQMKTVSNSDVNKVDWSEFEKLHKLFETLYPHVYEVMEVDRVGRAGLQFHYHPRRPQKAASSHEPSGCGGDWGPQPMES